MFDGKSISLLTRTILHWQPGKRPLIFLAGWVICAGSMLLCGCSKSITLDGANPLDKTAAKIKQVLRQPPEPAIEPGSRATDMRSANVQSNLQGAMRGANSNPLTARTKTNPPAEVVRAAYQQPASSTYSTSEFPTAQSMRGHPDLPTQDTIQAPAPAQDSLKQYSEMDSRTNQQQMNSIPNGSRYRQVQPGTHFSPSQSNGQPSTQGPQPVRAPHPANPTISSFSSRGHPNVEYHQSTISQFSDSPSFDGVVSQPSYGAAGGTGHLVDGMNLYGSELRQRTVTATELALHLRGENEILKNEIHALRAQLKQLSRQIDDQAKQLSESRENVFRAQGVSAELRQSVAKLTVKVQDLEKEKVLTEQNADKALREIESTLDDLLLNSVSKLRNPQPSGGSPK